MGWSCLGGVAASAFLASAPIEAVGLANLGNQILIASTILVIVAALVLAAIGPVSYTHLTLPTICSV